MAVPYALLRLLGKRHYRSVQLVLELIEQNSIAERYAASSATSKAEYQHQVYLEALSYQSLVRFSRISTPHRDHC